MRNKIILRGVAHIIWTLAGGLLYSLEINLGSTSSRETTALGSTGLGIPVILFCLVMGYQIILVRFVVTILLRLLTFDMNYILLDVIMVSNIIIPLFSVFVQAKKN